MRIFVSTKYLSLIELVSRFGRRPPKVKPFAEAHQGRARGLLERLPIADHRLKPLSQESADRTPLLGCEQTSFAEQV
jgi:hypothetical protein